MTYTTQVRKLHQVISTMVFGLLVLGPSAVRAAECPAMSPEDPQERRRLAKEWFGAAEAAENEGNDAEATRAYACSYKMVAHPFTAFNLGRVAERSGDNDLALKMFKAYLTLKPDAQDKEEVKNKIKEIEDKIAAASTTPGETGIGEAAATAVTPPEEPAETPAEPPKEALAPPPEPKPAPLPPQIRRSSEPDDERPPSHAVEWIVGGASVAALVAGVGLNLAARTKMSSCRADAEKSPQDLQTANNECNAARPLAYWSYGMFAAAAVGAALDAVLIVIRHPGSTSRDDDDSSMSFMLVPSGALLSAHGRF
jgi:hypothetical protein